jgi:hypothetical protein
MNDAMEEAAQRRAGLLPPSTRPPAATPAQPGDPSAIGGVDPNQGKKVGGSCPFIGRAA